MSGGGSPAQTQQVSKVELPAWVNQASEENYGLAKQIAGRSLDQYTGQQVADTSSLTNQANSLIKSNVGSTTGLTNKATGMLDQSATTLGQTQPLYDKATGSYDAAGKLQNEAADIYRGTTGALDVNKYLNPYTDEVETNAIRNANESLAEQLLGVETAANAKAGFGGSRGAIESAVTRAKGTRSIGDLSAELRKAGIDYATETGLKDRAGIQAGASGMLSAATGLGNTGAGYLSTASGLRDTATGYQNAATGYNSTAATQLAGEQQDVSNLMAAGQQDQAQQQKVIDAAMKQFYEKRDYPIEGLNTRLAALGMSPYGRTETTNKTSTAEDKGTDWATVGLGALKTLPAIAAMSDRSTKTDIEKVDDSGPVPMYAYRYKGDPKTYPKVVGPMAQDVEKIMPKAVGRVGKKKVINLSNVMEALR